MNRPSNLQMQDFAVGTQHILSRHIQDGKRSDRADRSERHGRHDSRRFEAVGNAALILYVSAERNEVTGWRDVTACGIRGIWDTRIRRRRAADVLCHARVEIDPFNPDGRTNDGRIYDEIDIGRRPLGDERHLRYKVDRIVCGVCLWRGRESREEREEYSKRQRAACVRTPVRKCLIVRAVY